MFITVLTDQDIGERMRQHAKGNNTKKIAPKIFDEVRFLEVDNRDIARNFEGSMLFYEWENKNNLLNTPKPVTQGYYHSYSEDMFYRENRRLMSLDEINKEMENATTKKVDAKGKICK